MFIIFLTYISNFIPIKRIYYLIHKIIFYVIILDYKNLKFKLWGQRICAPRPIPNNKPEGPAEEENIRG